MQKKVLVTGGAGFVGTNLVKRLCSEGHRVVVIDNLSAGKRGNYIQLVERYIEDSTENIEARLEEARFVPDIIYHLGEYSKITPSFDEIEKVFEYNIKGSFSVLEYARNKNIPIIYAASSTRLALEGENHSPYSFFKALVVQMVKNYGDWYGLQYSICYFYNVYGEYQGTWDNEWQTVMGIFENQYRNKQPLTIVGDGLQRRDFTYVGDIVNGLIVASRQIRNEEYQLGSGKDYSILEVANMFGTEITFVPARRGDRRYGRADVDKTLDLLGWKAEMTLERWIQQIKESI
jgi:UDP-glucose 4-epimerase